MELDAIIIGGSYAGLSAALQLARARRSIVVIDAATRRNRHAESAHGFLGQDGRAPGAIVADARAQLMAYPSVEWIESRAVNAAATDGGFSVRAENGGAFHAKRLVLATGVVDELPDIPGLTERWGRSVFHCPYCHGYELDEGPIGVVAVSPMSVHQALVLSDWGPTTLFTNDALVPDAEQAAQLKRRDVTIESLPVERVSGERAEVVLRGGRIVSLNGLFVLPHTRAASSLAEQLGCAFEDGPLGSFIKTSGFKETSVPGVFACGDAAVPAGSVALAAGAGTMAGVGAHQSLIFRDS